MASGKKSSRIVGTGGEVRVQMESAVCDECQEVCWDVSAWVHDIMGKGEKACVFYLEHERSQARAMRRLAMAMLGWSAHLLEDEEHAYLLEHQPRLW